MRLTSRSKSSRSSSDSSDPAEFPPSGPFHLTSRGSRGSRHSRAPRPSRSSRGPLSSLSSTGRRLSSFAERDAFVTLFKRDPGDKSPPTENDVTMSAAGQKIIPATFNLVPIEPPESTTPGSSFDQAGGHNGSFMIQGRTLVKKVTDREARFYERAQQGQWPTSLLPKFYGRVGDEGIKIENLTHGFARPCVMDLKMGFHTVEDNETSLLKKLKMGALDRVTGSRSAGCRLEGLSMYRTLENRRVKGTKAQSHSISAHVRVSLQDVLTFFLTDESGVRSDVALRFQRLVEDIRSEFTRNDKLLFIGSSILLIYDNDNHAPYMHWVRALRKLHTLNEKARLSEDQISGLTRRTRCDVRMIDFAHTGPMRPGMVQDDGYIAGLDTIIAALKAIRIKRTKPIFSFSSAVVDLMEETRAHSRMSHDGQQDFTFDTLLSELTPLAEGCEGSLARSSGSLPERCSSSGSSL